MNDLLEERSRSKRNEERYTEYRKSYILERGNKGGL